MNYFRHTIGSRNPVKRWLHNQRFEKSILLLDIQSGHRVLDFGCGNGELARRISERFRDVELVAYDPAISLIEEARIRLRCSNGVRITTQLPRQPQHFDRIACLETIEHLPDEELMKALNAVHDLLSANGFCLFTFPVEHGVAALLKNSYRLLAGRDDYVSLFKLMRTSLRLPVPRQDPRQLDTCPYIYSHVGFSADRTLELLRDWFHIQQMRALPCNIQFCGLASTIAVTATRR